MKTGSTTRAMLLAAAMTMTALVPGAVTGTAAAQEAEPANWPQIASPDAMTDAETEAMINRLIARMSLEEKVGQMIQADIASIVPEDLRRYPLGSVLAGGSSAPLGKPDRSPGSDWADTATAFERVAMEQRQGHVAIPLLFGVDAVHGNNNIVGATLFPHNIGLGAARDPDLIRRIGLATAREAAAAGVNWTFAPTVAVPQDDRWGRTYEGYSEDPAIVRAYAGEMTRGLQGEPGEGTIQEGYIAGSAKHFLGDGGTTGGIDQGDNAATEQDLVDVHAAGYPPAIEAGIMSIMASFNSWHGRKMHGNESLLTDVLKERMGFDGFVVGDWNGHAQIEGCTATDCPQTFIAGLDMAMAPDSWKGLFDTTLAHARAGRIPMERVDDAVCRILRVKAGLGLFDPARPWTNRDGVIGSAEHRAIAREAVRKSLVLLKNDGVLPLKADANLLVAGRAADDIGLQSGGWTLSWQGDGNTNADFPNGQSIFSGIQEAVSAAGGSATLSTDGSFTRRPDAAIVVFGEEPYAEMRGDVRTLEFQAGDKQALELLQKLKAQGIPTVSVFLSGRPLWVNPELNRSDAFVAAWLPGSEGGGIADVLIADADGAPRHDFTGRLSFSWPKTAGQFTLNAGDEDYDPLFPLGYGLSYASPGTVPQLAEVAGVDASLANTSLFFARGRVPAPFAWEEGSAAARSPVDGPQTQEGAVRLSWSAGTEATARIAGPELDLTRETNAKVLLQIEYRVAQPASGPVTMSLGSGTIDASALFDAAGEWRTVRVPLECFAAAGTDVASVSSPFALTASGPLTVDIADLRLATDPEGAFCPLEP